MVRTPIIPYEDKKNIESILKNDEYIKKLGFTQFYLTNTTADKLTSGSRQIFIYNAPSRDSDLNNLILGQIIQIDVSAPLAEQGKADLCISQVIALLDGYEWSKHSRMEVIAPSPVPLACQSGFYCVAARFLYYTSKITNLKS